MNDPNTSLKRLWKIGQQTALAALRPAVTSVMLAAAANAATLPAPAAAFNQDEHQLVQAFFIPIELVFPAFIVFILLFVGWEKRSPRRTNDIYRPDYRRQAERQARRDARADFEKLNKK